MKNFPQIASRIFNRPLLLDSSYARLFFGALSDRMNIETLITISGQKMSKKDLKVMAQGYSKKQNRPYRVVNNIAIIPIIGTLTHKLGSLTPYSGMTGYDGIRVNLDIAINDSDVKGILLDIDSPGGEVSGCFDCADYIYAQRDTKPIWSIANELTASAAYAIASASSKIITPRTGELGSIGVLTAHVDQSKMLKKQGVKVTLIYSGAYKVDGNPYEKLKKSTQEKRQSEINNIRQLFVQIVARNRGVEEQHIYDTEAQVYLGQEAVSAKLADKVMSFDQTLIEFDQYLSTNIGQLKTGAKKMAKVQKSPTEAGSNLMDSKGALKKIKTKFFKKGAKEERSRIASILQSEQAVDRMDKAHQLALGTSLSSKDAITVLAQTEKTSISPLHDAMANTLQPKIGADHSNDENLINDSDTMMSAFNLAKGKK